MRWRLGDPIPNDPLSDMNAPAPEVVAWWQFNRLASKLGYIEDLVVRTIFLSAMLELKRKEKKE